MSLLQGWHLPGASVPQKAQKSFAQFGAYQHAVRTARAVHATLQVCEHGQDGVQGFEGLCWSHHGSPRCQQRQAPGQRHAEHNDQARDQRITPGARWQHAMYLGVQAGFLLAVSRSGWLPGYMVPPMQRRQYA